MEERQAIICYCKTFDGVTEDYPFGDDTAAMRHSRGKKRIFALLIVHNGQLLLNVKNQPGWCEFWREQYPGTVLPGYHMNKQHWNSVILGRGVPREHIEQMIEESYLLTRR